MKNNIKNNERVEVMALFGYEMTPCEPLSFKRRGDVAETEINELAATKVKFVNGVAYHIFDVVANHQRFILEFNSNDLHWYLTLA